MSVELSRSVVRGTTFLVTQSIFGKLTALAGQIVLARILVPEAWGIFAMGLAASAFANLVGQYGLLQILVQRFEEFYSRTCATFLFSAVSGSIAAFALALFAPIWASTMDEPRLVTVLLLLSAEVFFVSLTVVPTTTLQTHMRFGTLAGVGAVAMVLQTGLSVAFAYSGFNELSLALPKPIIAFFRLAALWKLSNPQLTDRLDTRYWIVLLRNGSPALLAGIAYTVTQQADYLILGSLLNPPTVGLYFLAFSLSTQVTFLLTSNVQTVLLSAFSQRKSEPEKLHKLVLRTTRLLALIVFPVCCALAVGAENIIRLLFGERWLDAVPILRILSFAAAVRVIVGPLAVLLQAQGRFGLSLKLHMVSSVLFLTIIGVSTALAGAIGTAVGVLCHALLTILIFSSGESQSSLSRFYVIIQSLAPCMFATTLGGTAALLAIRAMPELGVIGWPLTVIHLAVIGFVGATVYFWMLYWLARNELLDLLNLLKNVFVQKTKEARVA